MSCSRHCAIYLASNGKWYLELASREHGERNASKTYGPFDTGGAAKGEMDFHSNPGAILWDKTGNAPPPTKSPNGAPIQPPSAKRRQFP